MTLPTNLDHVETAAQLSNLIAENENVMVCCGRMGPMCTPVYSAMLKLKSEFEHVKFFDMAFDNPEAAIIRNLPECSSFMGLPFVVYYKNGKVVKATSSIQQQAQIVEILNENFG